MSNRDAKILDILGAWRHERWLGRKTDSKADPLACTISRTGDDSREEGRPSVAGCRPVARGGPRRPDAAGDSRGALAAKTTSERRAAIHPAISPEDRPHKTSFVADDASVAF